MNNLETKLYRLAKESENELKEMGFSSQLECVGYIDYTISNATTRLGQCVNKSSINISKWLLEIGNDTEIKNTIIHEILHTFKDTKGHGEQWKKYAKIINDFGKYNITRTTSITKIMQNNGVNIEKQREMLNKNYEITCLQCGETWYFNKICGKTLYYYKNNKMTHKSCKGKHFKVVDLKNNKVLIGE